MCRQVKLSLISLSKEPESRTECFITYQKEPICYIEFSSQSIGQLNFSDSDLFECLRILRLRLEAEGWYILCNGSRIDAYISGMARQMSKGERIYLHDEHSNRTSRKTVNIFDPTTEEKVGSVSDQIAYFESWCKHTDNQDKG